MAESIGLLFLIFFSRTVIRSLNPDKKWMYTFSNLGVRLFSPLRKSLIL